MNAIAHNETETFAKVIEAIKKSAQRSEEVPKIYFYECLTNEST